MEQSTSYLLLIGWVYQCKLKERDSFAMILEPDAQRCDNMTVFLVQFEVPTVFSIRAPNKGGNSFIKMTQRHDTKFERIFVIFCKEILQKYCKLTKDIKVRRIVETLKQVQIKNSIHQIDASKLLSLKLKRYARGGSEVCSWSDSPSSNPTVLISSSQPLLLPTEFRLPYEK